MNYLFEENQKFNQWWLWSFLIIIPILSLMPFDDEGIKSYNIIIGFTIPILFYLFELRVKISNQGIHYQFFPIHFKKHLLRIDEIEKIEALQYKPISDYGGWGIRYGFKGKAYNVSGNKGVKIYLSNGRNILFGSQRYQDLEKALRKINN